MTIEGVVPAQVRGPELEQPVRGVALNVLVKLRWYGSRDPIVFRHVFHLVPVDGRWTWLLAAPVYDAYRAGRCPVEKSVAA